MEPGQGKTFVMLYVRRWLMEHGTQEEKKKKIRFFVPDGLDIQLRDTALKNFSLNDEHLTVNTFS